LKPENTLGRYFRPQRFIVFLTGRKKRPAFLKLFTSFTRKKEKKKKRK